MPPAVTITVLVAVGVTALWSMRAGWVRRGRRSAAVVPTLPPVPDDGDPALGGPLTGPLEATYVSSTVAGDWLERVVAHDLGSRSRAVVRVWTGGVRIERDGAADLFIAAGALRAVGTAPGMAGKYVGGDGLVVLTWQVPDGDARLDTGLHPRRAEDRAALLDAARALVPPAGTSTSEHTSGPPSTDAGETDDPTDRTA